MCYIPAAFLHDGRTAISCVTYIFPLTMLGACTFTYCSVDMVLTLDYGFDALTLLHTWIRANDGKHGNCRRVAQYEAPLLYDIRVLWGSELLRIGCREIF
jgi:hypothetical protein